MTTTNTPTPDNSKEQCQSCQGTGSINCQTGDKCHRCNGSGMIPTPENYTAICKAVIESYPSELNDYRNGKKALLGFFVGQFMKRLNNDCDHTVIVQEMKRQLDNTLNADGEESIDWQIEYEILRADFDKIRKVSHERKNKIAELEKQNRELRDKTVLECRDKLLDHLFNVIYENGYPIKAVPQARIVELPALMKI